jgi:hypothetical protein
VHQNTRSQVSRTTETRTHSCRASSERLVSIDQSSVATYTTQDPRSSNISSNNTPQSDYGLPPSSARSSGFPPDHLRYSQYSHAPQHPGVAGTMAQPTSPSNSLPERASNGNANANAHHMRSNSDVPIDPSISQASPTYPPYSPYPQGQDMQHAYQPQHAPPYMQQRPPHEQWAGYPPQHGMPGPYPHPGPGVQGPPQSSAGGRSGQVWNPDATMSRKLSRKRTLTRDVISRSIPLSLFRVRSSTSVRAEDTRKLSACTNVDGTDAKKPTAH